MSDEFLIEWEADSDGRRAAPGDTEAVNDCRSVQADSRFLVVFLVAEFDFAGWLDAGGQLEFHEDLYSFVLLTPDNAQHPYYQDLLLD